MNEIYDIYVLYCHIKNNINNHNWAQTTQQCIVVRMYLYHQLLYQRDETWMNILIKTNMSLESIWGHDNFCFYHVCLICNCQAIDILCSTYAYTNKIPSYMLLLFISFPFVGFLSTDYFLRVLSAIVIICFSSWEFSSHWRRRH